jgi:hypothetical protein
MRNILVTLRNSLEGGAFNLWWIYKEHVMKKVLLLLVAILAASSLALGQAATMPAVQTPVKVLVVPFTPIGETGGHEWVGAAIQESLLTDASLDTVVQATAMDRPLAKNDLSQATVAAKGTGATLVVFGAYLSRGAPKPAKVGRSKPASAVTHIPHPFESVQLSVELLVPHQDA